MRRGGRRGKNLGVLALSRETGYSAATISRKLSRGLSPDNIRSQARLVVAQERAEAAEAHAKSQIPPSPVPNQVDQQVLAPILPFAPQSVRTGRAKGGEYEEVLAGNAIFEKLDSAKLRRALALAERGELDNMLRRGELVPVAYIRTWGSRFLTDARDTLMTGPSELQDTLAAESDPLKVSAILRAWLERVMNKFHQLDRLWGAD